MSPCPGCPLPTNAGSARLHGIQRHLASFLPEALLRQFWQEGFAEPRQPSFRLNALRLTTEEIGPSGPNSSAFSSHGHGAAGHQRDGNQPRLSSGSASTHGPLHRGTGSSAEAQAGVVGELLAGFGLDPCTPLETCPYYPLARLLPREAAAAARVAAHVHTLGPLRTGAVYAMGLSSMLPALALMGHVSAPAPPGNGPASVGGLARERHGANSASSASGGAGWNGSSGSGGGEDEKDGLRVLDLCAAPGGKTALLAELMGNRGTLLAVEASWPRFQRLRFNLERLVPPYHGDGDGRGPASRGPEPAPEDDMQRSSGFRRDPRVSRSEGAERGGLWRRGCVVSVHADGRKLLVDEHGLPLGSGRPKRRERGSQQKSRPRTTVCDLALDALDRNSNGDGNTDQAEEVYDRVLVDAPCSGLGRLQLHQPDTFSHWDEKYAAHHVRRQRQLLLRAAALVRPGGSLVYSTCTLDPRENEGVIAWLLARVPGLRVVDPCLPHPPWPPVALHPLAASFAYCDTRASSAELHPTATSSPAPPLRAALEAHRPACTYSPLLDGPAGLAVAAAAADGAAECAGRVGLRGHGRGGIPEGPAAGGVRGELRDQLLSCVRVAPGPTYEGFFLAQLVKGVT